MTEQQTCGAMVNGTRDGMPQRDAYVPCGQPIRGSGPCAFCGLAAVDHGEPMDERHPYQPSIWEHVECMDPGCSMKRGPNCDYEGGHRAQPIQEGART